MYLYQNTQNSQNKHQVLNRIVKSIKKQVKYSDVDDYFWKIIKQQAKLLKIAYENNDLVKQEEIKNKTKLFICAKQLAKLQHFIKSHWHNKKFQAQELYVLVKQDTESKYGWNYKTNRKWRKITLTDYATIIGYSSSTPVKLNWLLNRADINVALYTNLIALYKKFIQLDIKTRMFKWLLSNKNETNDNKCGMFDLSNSNNAHSINDPPDDDWQELFAQD
ncbi:MAG: hypothetical protein IJK72_00500 [Mycoplasma sp.]|nr:hypothetical protein [Mycoplasma sp.]